MIRRWLVWGVCCLAWTQGTALAQRLPVSDALTRPAVMVRQPAKAVLLSVAYAAARLVAVGERGVIVISDDDGRQWRQVPAPTSVTLTSVAFADDRHGVAVGHGGVVLATDDGGQSWALRLDGRQAAERALAAADTAEQIREAERLIEDGPDKPFLSVLMWDARRWLVAGAYGLIFETRDAGTSWTPWMARVPNEGWLHWYVLARQGDTLLLAGEQGLLARSLDGGATFDAIASPYRGSWFAGGIDQDGRWLLGGLRGSTWRSADAGATWTPLANPVPSSIVAMTSSQHDPGGERFVVTTQAGVLLETDADAWRPLNPGQPVPMPAAFVPLRSGGFLSVGMTGVVLVSSNARMDRP